MFALQSPLDADPVDVGASIIKRLQNVPANQQRVTLQQQIALAVRTERDARLRAETQAREAVRKAQEWQRAYAQLQARVDQLLKENAELRQTVSRLQKQAGALGFKGSWTLVPIDSGTPGIFGDALSSLWQVSPGVAWHYGGLAVTENVANSFVVNVFSVAGFPNIGQGVNVTGNGTNAGLGLAPFVLNSTSRMVVPFAGIEFAAQTPLSLQVRSTTSPLISTRFIAVLLLGLRMNQVCDAAGNPLFRR